MVAKVIEERLASGDVGPCSKDGCSNRALWIVDVSMKGLRATVYACQEHKP